MPISLDLDHIMGPFKSIGRFQLTPIAEIFERLGQWLKDRVKKADLLDEASRSFPVVSFYNEAVALWLDPIQKGALSPDGNPPGFGAHMQAAGEAFLKGIHQIPEAYENEMILPRFFGTVSAAIQAILDSVIRFENPRPEMFDPRLRTASDLFGEAALAFRAFASSQPQLKEFLFSQVEGAREILTGGEAERQAAGSTPETLDRITRHILGALLILPQLPNLIAGLWESLSLYAKNTVIESFGRIEEKVFGLRRTMIAWFYVGFADFLLKALAFASAAGYIVTRQVAFWIDFIQLYGKSFMQAVAKFGNSVMVYLFDAAKGIISILDSIDEVLNYDLSPLFLSILGGLPGYIISKIAPIPRFTVLDFIHGPARVALVVWIESIAALLSQLDISPWDPLGLSDIQKRLHALAAVLNMTLSPLPPKKPETARPSFPKSFPSIFDSWFKNSSAPVLEKAFKDMAERLPDQASGIVDTASSVIERGSYLFDDAADAAARGMSSGELLAISNRAADLAQQAFGSDVDTLEKQVAEGETNVVARSFESWFAGGGFMVLSSFLQHYIGSMLDVFRKQEETGEELTVLITKTSPQILAQKAVLSRARMQQLTINARGRVLDDGLVQEIADCFRGAIQNAFQTGGQRIADLAKEVFV